MYQFVSDPAHGWLGVPLDEILDLGLAPIITPASYFQPLGRVLREVRREATDHVVWLEEGVDVSVYLRAKVFGHRYTEDMTWRDVLKPRMSNAELVSLHTWMNENMNQVHVNHSSEIRRLPQWDGSRYRKADVDETRHYRSA